MKEILLSVIIPMYNASSYISKCIRSIEKCKCNHELFEIIAVDDGSTDNTSNLIMDNFKEKNIVHIKKNNTGVSDTRNIGIQKSKGKYIVFVDSDDYVVSNYIDKIINIIKTNEFDLCLFRYNVINNDNIWESTSFVNPKKEKLIKSVVYQKSNAPWNKIYKRSIIMKNNIRFDISMKTSEDLCFTLDVLKATDKIIYSDEVLYNYIINDNGAVKNPKLCYIKDQILAFDKTIEMCNFYGFKVNQCHNEVVKRVYELLKKLKCDRKEIINELNEYDFFEKIKFMKLKIKQKIKYLLILLAYR